MIARIPCAVRAESETEEAPGPPRARLTMPLGPLLGDAVGNSVMAPEVVMAPIFPAPCSVNHSSPVDADAIPNGKLLDVGIGNSVNTPAGVSRPILLLTYSVNQIF